MSQDHLGGFEHVVILALLRLPEDAYGVTVRQELESAPVAKSQSAQSMQRWTGLRAKGTSNPDLAIQLRSGEDAPKGTSVSRQRGSSP